VSFIPCSSCGRRNCGYLSHVYWFAPLRDASAFRVRQRLCPDCLSANLESLLSPLDGDVLTCPACGISTEDDVFPVYVTWYPPKADAQRGAMSLCEQHNLDVRLSASQGATELAERDIPLPDRPVAAAVPASAVFSAIGRLDPGLKHGPGGKLYRQSPLPPEAAG
jgi:hypothetical protein